MDDEAISSEQDPSGIRFKEFLVIFVVLSLTFVPLLLKIRTNFR